MLLSRQVITLKVLNDQSHAAQRGRVITIVFEKHEKRLEQICLLGLHAKHNHTRTVISPLF